MEFGEFINKYTDVKVDYDGMYGAQCVDLFRQYCGDVLQIPHTGSCSTTGGAKDLFLDYEKMPLEKKYFKKITYPFKAFSNFLYGDVVVWNSNENNKYGHVAIFVANLKDSILVFEQDGFKQNGARLRIRSKNNILGILRFKGEIK